MPSRADILISVHRRFADGMIDGSKGVELRRRAPRVPPKTRIWIYEKAPTASVRALAILDSVHELPPLDFWSRYGPQTGLDLQEFNDYTHGTKSVCGLVLDHVHHLHAPVSLEALRKICSRFHPPQFYLKLPKSEPISRALSQEIACSCGACIA